MIKAEQMSLNTATVKEQCNLRQAIDLCARFGIGGIAPWRENLKECGLDEANRMIQDRDYESVVYAGAECSLWKTNSHRIF